MEEEEAEEEEEENEEEEEEFRWENSARSRRMPRPGRQRAHCTVHQYFKQRARNNICRVPPRCALTAIHHEFP